jgi:hypothetical protein
MGVAVILSCVILVKYGVDRVRSSMTLANFFAMSRVPQVFNLAALVGNEFVCPGAKDQGSVGGERRAVEAGFGIGSSGAGLDLVIFSRRPSGRRLFALLPFEASQDNHWNQNVSEMVLRESAVR